MDPIKRTYEDVMIFHQVASRWLAEHDKEHTKFHYALAKVSKKTHKLLSRYNEKIEEINIKHASEDEKKNIIVTERNEYVYTKENLLARNKERQALFETEVEVEPYIGSSVPELTNMERSAFDGFVLEDKEPEDEESDT